MEQLVARSAHNRKVEGSSPFPATKHMFTANAHSLGGKVTAVLLRERAVDRYNTNPNFCKFCHMKIEIQESQKISDVRRKKFCNKTCAARYNNMHTKRAHVVRKIAVRMCRKCRHLFEPHRLATGVLSKTQTCDYCIVRLRKMTKGELFKRRSTWQSARTAIQQDARIVYLDSGKALQCCKCGYKQHVDIAHIKAVAEFGDLVTVEEINAITNLLALCPNHHWEYDHSVI